MIVLLSEIHFWTTLEDIIVKYTDYGAFRYYSKKEEKDCLNSQSKKDYCEKRNILWNLQRKKPYKLKEKLKELEEYLVHNKIVCYTWVNNKLWLLFSCGLLVCITIAETGDIFNITFDKQLATKLQVNIICDGTIIGNQVICICNDGHILGYGGKWKDGWVLEGGPRRKMHYYGEWLAVWGKPGSEHPQPWTPLTKDHQRSNLHLYWINFRNPELLAYKQTDGEPIQVVVSKMSNRSLIVVEQKVTQRGAVSVEIGNFELIGNNLKRTSITSVPLQTQVSCTALSDFEDRLLIGCIDGSLALLDRNRGSTRTVKAAFIPTFAAWHCEGAVMVICNDRGQIQFFDTGLNPISLQISNEECTPSSLIDISVYINMQFTVASINWGPKDLIISLAQGPIILIKIINKLCFVDLAAKYLNLNQTEKVINLLLSWEFNEDSFNVLKRTVCFLMRQNMTKEIAQHVQNALGSYHNSPVPLPTNIRHRFENQVYLLTRRFFHQLIRANMFETAFLLAVDLGHHDLFMDLHFIAVKIGQTEMAAAARAQASSLLSRCTSEASDCSRSSCSQCSQSSHVSEDESNEDFKINMTNSSISNENYLTTDFNKPDPTTYNRPPPTPLSTNVVANNDFDTPPKLPFPPRATYVRAPQVPQISLNKINQNLPPLPKLRVGTSNQEPFNFSINNSIKNNTQIKMNPFTPPQFNDSLINFNEPPFEICSNKNISSKQNPFSQIKINLSTPSSISSSQSDGLNSNTQVNLNNLKKPQAKVKFSDTVTAFIVPEIKRPVRPTPPAHVTDPQRELADSLPLCHPNEDYLKDFTPISKDEDGDQSEQHPKIKVVHFGVV